MTLPLEDITETYRAEYYEKASASQQGWLGKINRLLNKLPGHDKAESRFFTTAVAVGAPLALLTVVIPVLMPVAILLTVAAVATSLVAHSIACKASAKKLTSDIANGTLPKRYAEEILKPKNDAALTPLIERLSSPLSQKDKCAVSAFSACAAEIEESAGPAAKTASPKP